MADQRSKHVRRVSRRDFLFTGAASAGAVLVVGMTTSRAVASSKMSPRAMQYRQTPNGGQRCDNCANFQPPASCKLVDGAIAASGWCILYRPKK